MIKQVRPLAIAPKEALRLQVSKQRQPTITISGHKLLDIDKSHAWWWGQEGGDEGGWGEGWCGEGWWGEGWWDEGGCEARACGRPWLLAERELGGAKWQLRLLCVRLRSDGGRSLLPSEAEWGRVSKLHKFQTVHHDLMYQLLSF